MKRFYRTLLIVAILVVLGTALAICAEATELKTGIGVVEANALRLRDEASTDGEIISTAYAGDSVVIIRKVGNWYLVNYNLDIGYMSADYITFKDRENVKIGYASFDTASNVRATPGTNGKVLKQAPGGETCFIIGFNCSWYKVSFNGTIGYVRSDLLTLLEKPYSNAGSKGNTYKTGNTNSGNSGGDTAKQSLGSQIASYAKQFVGYCYAWGGSSPSSGFDCSGLVYHVATHFGYNIARTADAQYYNGSAVNRSDLQAGDIVFFSNTYTSGISHVGIYIGDGKFVHSANSGSGVITSGLNESYYSAHYAGARRLG